MKLLRLYQPRNPIFWIVVVLNLLSVVLGLITHNYVLGGILSAVLIFFALGNAVLGAYLIWRLLNS